MPRCYLLDTDTCSYVMKRHPMLELTRWQIGLSNHVDACYFY